MRTILTLLAAASLAFFAAPRANAEASMDLPRLDASQVAKSLEMKGDIERVHNNYLLAISYYQQALRAEPKNPQILNKLGISELKTGERGSARKHFSQAVKSDPRNISALKNLGAVYCL